ncbi:unnamed protein product, partial [Closterium sp. NIES-53]
MATLSVLKFDHEGRLIHFDTWLDDLQLYLLSDSRDGVSLFDHTSGASLSLVTPPSPLAPSYASATAVDILGTEDVGAASAANGKRRSGKGKGGKSGGGGIRGGGGGGGGGSAGGGGGGGSGGGSGGFGGGGGGNGGSGGGGGGASGSGGGDSGGGRAGVVQRGGSGGGQWQQQQRRSKTPMPQQLREWFSQRVASGGSVRCPYVIRT